MKKLLTIAFALLTVAISIAQGTETFNNIPANSASYAAQTWTGDNTLSWNATDARTDQTITGRAICIRNGAITCNSIPNGIGSITFKHQQVFAGSNPVLEVRINGNLVGTANPLTTVETTTINNINVSGNFNLEIKQVTAGLRISVDDVSWTAYNGIPCITPTAQPSNLNFTAITTSSLAIDFTAASPAANEYLVIRSTNSTLTSSPVNGTIYNEGDVIGNAVVVDQSNATSFNISGLTPSTTYYFWIYSVSSTCSGGPLFLNTNPLNGNTTTASLAICTAPTAAPTNLVLTPASTSINGSFTASTTADGYLVVRSLNNTLSASPTNGTSYNVGSSFGGGTVVKFGTGNTFSSSGLANTTTYNFFVFAVNNFNCTGGPFYNTTSLRAAVATSSSATGEPTGYYNAATGLSCSSLKTSLKNIITNGNNLNSYSSLYSQYAETDIKPREVGSGSSNVIWDIYSDNPTGTDPYNYNPTTQQCGSYSAEGSCYNREHTFPQSWFTTGTANGPGTDYIQVLPTDGFVNGKRSNYLYGEVGTANYTSLNGSKLGTSSVAGISGTVFEPINTYKGDVARIFLYMVTRYQDNITSWANLSSNGAAGLAANTFPSVNINYLKLMIKWHNQDPVSQKEIDRNNGAYSFQGNRNPFVDRPEFVDAVWNSTCPGLSALPVDILYFSGKLNGDKIDLQWQVGAEFNVAFYTVERSFDGTNFTPIANITATQKGNYNVNDAITNFKGKKLWYRIKKQDKSGSFSFSEVFNVVVPSNVKFTVYPNPSKNYVQLQFTGVTTSQKMSIQIIDAMGKLVQFQNLNTNTNTVFVNVNSLQNGTYIVKAIQNGETFIQKIIVAK
ncbi:MAG: endonuclease [Chitinophagaceae bacterium]